MKTEKQLNKDILEMTMKIDKKFPELSKYIDEMPVHNSPVNSDNVNSKGLSDYDNSLHTLFNKYAKGHNSSGLIKK